MTGPSETRINEEVEALVRARTADLIRSNEVLREELQVARRDNTDLAKLL
jgi:hypothetical protein